MIQYIESILNLASPAGWTLLAVGALIVGISKTGVPGSGILAVVLFAAASEFVPDFTEMQSTGTILPLLLLADLFAVSWYRRHAVWRHLVRLMPMALAGIIIGYLLMHYLKQARPLPEKAYGLIIGGIVLVMLALSIRMEIKRWLANRNRPQASPQTLAWQPPGGGATTEAIHGSSATAQAVAAVPAPAIALIEEDQPTASWPFVIVMGILAGVTTMMANAAGPIMVVYLTAMRLPKQRFIGTGAWYYLLLNCVKIPFQMMQGGIDMRSLKIDLALAPLVVAGALAGFVLVKIVPEKAFKVLIHALALVAAIKLCYTGLMAIVYPG